ncbi:MAG: hypothetical protein H6735_06635 [Alphaproteobacteria bacterium]|nr:hypothetical protein [Alphaproteobacteria bacterium]
MLRWMAALVCFAVAFALVGCVPPLVGLLRFLPLPWVVATWLVIALAVLALASAWPLAAVAWWLIVRRRWVLRGLAIGLTWLLMVPWPAWYALILSLTVDDEVGWVSEGMGDRTAHVQITCRWHSGDEFRSCDADGYLQRGWSPSLTRIGTIHWTEGEARCCFRRWVRESSHVVYRVHAYSDVHELRF